MMFCSNCGHELHENAVFCSNCGEAVKRNNNEELRKKNIDVVEDVKEKDFVNNVKDGFWYKKMNRKQFFAAAIVMLSLLGMLRTTASIDSMNEFYVGLIAWYIILWCIAKLRCNHIGVEKGRFIGICILLLIPLLSLLAWGYLVFKKGRVCKDEK